MACFRSVCRPFRANRAFSNTQGFYEADFVNTRRVISYSLFSGWVYSRLDDKVSVAGPELFPVRLADRKLVVFLAAGVLGIFAVLDGA